MALQAENIQFSYQRGRPVLSDVSMTAQPGTLTVVAGPNGAGKSTLLRLLLGDLAPSDGKVTLSGADVRAMGHKDRARKLSFVPQHAAVAFGFTVRQVVRFGLYSHSDAEEAEVDRALEHAELADRADEPMSSLSAGQQQRATLARAFVQARRGTGERYLLADEPLSAMDPRHVLRSIEQLRSLAGEGVGVVLVLHDLGLAMREADHVVLMATGGNKAAEAPPAEALAPAELERVFGVEFEPARGERTGQIALLPVASADGTREVP